MTDQALRIPLAQIEEHRDFRLRLEYEHLDELATSFIETAKAEWKAGRTSSNGQQQPGRAILSEGRDRWELYSGLRRRLAMQKAYEATKDPRFSYYWLCDDTGIPREEMLRRALEDRAGIRENLTALEEVRVFKLFSDVDFRKLVAAGDERERFSRLEKVAQVFSDNALANLHKVEASSGSYVFKLPALEFLSALPEGIDLYMTAAEIAANRYDQSKKKMEDAYTFRKEVLGLGWFLSLFPSAAKPEENRGGTTTAGGGGEAGSGQGDRAGKSHESANPPTSSNHGEQKQPADDSKITSGGNTKATETTPTGRGEGGQPAPAPLLRLEEGVLTLACPYCDGPVPFKPGSVHFDGYRLSLEGKASVPVAAETVTGEFTDACELCGERFFYNVRLAEGQYQVRTGKIGDAEAAFAGGPVTPETVVWNDSGSHWGAIDADGKVIRDFPVVRGKEADQRQQKQEQQSGKGWLAKWRGGK